MTFPRQLYQQSLGLWKSLNLQQRLVLLLGSAVVLGGLLYLIIFQTTLRYDTLFSNLQTADAGEVAAKLKEMSVPFKTSGEGTTISVPAARVAETRLLLAEEGLPRGGGGYEIFNQPRLGITRFEQWVNLKRSIEGELARTIDQLKEVQWSRVQIAMPEEHSLPEQEQKPTASVFLEFAPGFSLERRQIGGIQHLVASSIEGLSPENVTILDQYANLLSMPVEESLASSEISASQFEVRSRVEKYFHDKLQNMFDRVVGPGNSVVSVSVELDFDQIERTEEKYDPDTVVVRSVQRQKEQTSLAVQAEGVEGTTSDATDSVSATGMAGGPLKETSYSITNYEISKTVDHIIKSQSSIKGVSVAVAVGGLYNQVKQPDGVITNEYAPRSEEDLQKYQRMILAAVGNPATKSIEVINVPLSTAEAEKEPEPAVAPREEETRNIYFLIWKTAITVVALFLLFLLIRTVVRRLLPTLPPEPTKAEFGGDGDVIAAEEADFIREVKEIVENEPEEAALLFKVWLNEQK
jgi:flagellar M-ring protein FliF